MSSDPRDIQALCASASELYERADWMEAGKSPRLRDAAKRLRDEARAILCEVERELQTAQSSATAENALKDCQERGREVAKAVKYRTEALCMMRDAGTLQQLARDFEMPIETLEFYIARTIEKHYQRASATRMKLTMKRSFVREEVTEDARKAIEKLGLYGLPEARIVELTEQEPRLVSYVLHTMTETQRVARKVAIKERRDRKRWKVVELRQEGCSWHVISSRTGYSEGTVQRVWQQYQETGSVATKLRVAGKNYGFVHGFDEA